MKTRGNYPTFGRAASDDTVGVHPQQPLGMKGHSTRLGWDTGASWIPPAMESPMESHEPSLVLNLHEPFCHLHILINNSSLYEFLSNSKSQMSQCLYLNTGASHLSKQSHLCLWEGCGKHVI